MYFRSPQQHFRHFYELATDSYVNTYAERINAASQQICVNGTTTKVKAERKRLPNPEAMNLLV
jgi:hypothetical protein